MTPVGFEPTQLALVELESTPLAHSSKVSLAMRLCIWGSTPWRRRVLHDFPALCLLVARLLLTWLLCCAALLHCDRRMSSRKAVWARSLLRKGCISKLSSVARAAGGEAGA